MSEDGKQQEPYYIIPDISRGDLPVYHVYSVQVQAQANVPVYPIYETPSKLSPDKHNSRGDGKSAVNCEEKLGRTRDMTTCTSCQQHVMTDITYKVGRFAKQMCVFFAILG